MITQGFSGILEDHFSFQAPVSNREGNAYDIGFTCSMRLGTGEVIIPCIIGASIHSKLTNLLNEGRTSLEEIPQVSFTRGFSLRNSTTKRTVITIFREGLRIDNNKFVKITTNKGIVYYVGRGVVLDANRSPLLIFARKYRFGGGNFREISRVLLVSSNVYRRDDMLCKSIRKDIIEYMVTSTSEREVIISDLRHYITHCLSASPSDVGEEVAACAETIGRNSIL